MFYVKNPTGDWLLEPAAWYHGNPTFTSNSEQAAQFTEAEADAHLEHPRMHEGAYKEAVA